MFIGEVSVRQIARIEVEVRLAQQFVRRLRPHHPGRGQVGHQEPALSILHVDVVRDVIDQRAQELTLLCQRLLRQFMLGNVLDILDRALQLARRDVLEGEAVNLQPSHVLAAGPPLRHDLVHCLSRLQGLPRHAALTGGASPVVGFVALSPHDGHGVRVPPLHGGVDAQDVHLVVQDADPVLDAGEDAGEESLSLLQRLLRLLALADVGEDGEGPSEVARFIEKRLSADDDGDLATILRQQGGLVAVGGARPDGFDLLCIGGDERSRAP